MIVWFMFYRPLVDWADLNKLGYGLSSYCVAAAEFTGINDKITRQFSKPRHAKGETHTQRERERERKRKKLEQTNEKFHATE